MENSGNMREKREKRDCRRGRGHNRNHEDGLAAGKLYADCDLNH